jgi:hypothetical protein
VTFERKLVEQRILLDLPIPIIDCPPAYRDLRKFSNYPTISKTFFNEIGATLPIRL